MAAREIKNGDIVFCGPGGSDKMITDIGEMGFDEHARQIFLIGCFPDITPDQILENMESEIRTDRAVEIDVPTQIELILLQEKCDPHGLIL